MRIYANYYILLTKTFDIMHKGKNRPVQAINASACDSVYGLFIDDFEENESLSSLAKFKALEIVDRSIG